MTIGSNLAPSSSSKWELNCCNVQMNIPKRIVLVSILTFIIVILIIVIIVLATNQPKLVKVTDGIKPSSCKTASCFSYSAELVKSLDVSVNPCDNFYQYACGKWIHEEVLEDNMIMLRLSDIQAKQITYRLKKMLETRPKTSDPLFQKVQNAYDACILQNDSVSTETVKKHIKSLGGWPMSYGKTWLEDNKIKDLDNLFKHLAKIRHSWDNGVLFNAAVDKNLKNSGTIPTIEPPRDRPREPTDKDEREKLIQNMVNNSKTFAGSDKFDEEFARDSASSILTLLSEIYDAKSGLSENPLANYKQTKFGAFENKFHWVTFAQSFYDKTFTDDDLLAVVQYQYFDKIESLLKTIEKPTENKSVITSIIDFEIINIISTINMHTLQPLFSDQNVVQPTQPRWWFCVATMRKWFPFIIAKKYAEEFSLINMDTQITETIVSELKDAFGHRLQNLDWLDEDSKNISLTKLDKMKENFWGPEFANDPQKLEEYYKPFEIGSDHVANVINERKFSIRKNLEQLSNKNDFPQWPVEPLMVNAFYNPIGNGMYLPTGILQTPIFDPNRLYAMHFGSIGCVIGHELTHGFDKQGMQFNQDGIMKSWLTPTLTKKFNEKAKCFEEQYSKYSLTKDDVPMIGDDKLLINGTKTVNENIADNGGVQQAFSAYKKWIEKTGPETLPEVLKNFTADQVFFLSYAKFWCTKYANSKITLDTIKKGDHSPSKIRVLGTLSNFKEFAKAFNCNASHNMVMEDPCHLW